MRDYRLVTGHFGFDLTFHLEQPFTITLLRHPVDRLCSVYEFLRESFERNPGATDPDPDINALVQLWKVAVSRPIEAFLDSPEAPVRAALLQNPQARQLAQATPYLLTDLSDDLLRRIAEARLRSIDIAGCTDQFADTVMLTSLRLGWPPPQDLTNLRLNQTTHCPVRHHLTPSVTKRIEALASIDMELYEIARSKLAVDLADITRRR